MNYWLTRFPLGYRSYIHWCVGKRFFGWPAALTVMALLLNVQALDTVSEFGKTSLVYGIFLAPLMAIWVVPRLFPSRSEMGWQIASRVPRWRLVQEYSLLGLILFIFLWTLFLGLAWAIHSIFISQSNHVPATPIFVGWLWLHGLLSLLFFTGFAVLGSQLWKFEDASFLATGIWVAGLLLVRVNEQFSYILPFSAYYQLAKSEINFQMPLLGMQTGIIFLISLTFWMVGIWTSSIYQHQEKSLFIQKIRPIHSTQKLFAGSLFWMLRGPFLFQLIWQELHWAVRRKSLWIYLIVPIGLFTVIAGFYHNNTITDVIPLMMSNFLFFTPPLLAVLLVPALTRNLLSGREWFWCTPTVWTQTALAQLLSYCIIVLSTTVIWGAWIFVWGLVHQFWTWPQAFSLMGPVARLWLPMALAQACFVCGLALLLRQAVVVLALTCVVTVGLWLFADVLTLVTVGDVALVSLSFNPITGPVPDQSLAQSLVFAYLSIGFGIWLVALLLFPICEGRATWSPLAQVITSCCCLIALCVGVLVNWNFSQKAQELTVPVPIATDLPAWNVMHATHHARIGNDILFVESMLTLSHFPGAAAQSLSLQLNPGLALTDVEWDGQSASWKRSGGVVQIAPPNTEVTSLSEEPLDLHLHYSGWPVLLREDYAPATTVGILGDQLVSNFSLANVSYADGPYLQWFRDSDWTVWPHLSGPHVATQTNLWTIELPHAKYPIIAAPGGVMRTFDDGLRYSWQGALPSILLLAGPYDPPVVGEPAVWLGPWQRISDRERIKSITEMYQRLLVWSGNENPFQTAYFAFGQQLHFADTWLMVPAMPSDHGIETERALLDLAVRVAEDWLREQAAWKTTTYSGQGLHDQYAINCDWPEDARQSCFLSQDEYHENPQAPHGRVLDVDYCLYPSTRKCGRISLMRRAWAITLAYYIVAEPKWIQHEWDEWHRIAEIPGQSDVSHSLAGAPEHFHNVCRLSGYVLTMHELVEEHGKDFLHDWLQLMQVRHPAGATTAADDTVWQLAAELIGKEWIELHPTVCTETILVEG